MAGRITSGVLALSGLAVWLHISQSCSLARLRMQAPTGQITWRVEAVGEATTRAAFDARVVYHPSNIPSHDADPAALQAQLRTLGRAMHEGAFFGEAVPFAGTLPNVPLTLVVMSHSDSPPLRVSFATFDAQGVPGVHGWSDGPCTIIVHTAVGTVYTSLPVEPPPAWPKEHDGSA